jgi:hypothetical protein
MVRHHHCPPSMDTPIKSELLHPTVLYHSSPIPDIEDVEPKQRKTRDPNEGPKIFATPDKRLATIFMTPTDGSWVASGLHNNIPYIVISDKDKYLQLDRGGVIYYLPVETFEVDIEKGLREYEWTSSVPVKPLAKENYSSTFKAMIAAGVQVYFVDTETFEKMADLPGPEKVRMKMDLISENQRMNRNYLPFY